MFHGLICFVGQTQISQSLYVSKHHFSGTSRPFVKSLGGEDLAAIPEGKIVDSDEGRKLRDAQRSLHLLLKPEILRLSDLLNLSVWFFSLWKKKSYNDGEHVKGFILLLMCPKFQIVIVCQARCFFLFIILFYERLGYIVMPAAQDNWLFGQSKHDSFSLYNPVKVENNVPSIQ